MNAQTPKKRLLWCAVPTIFALLNPTPGVPSKQKAPLDRSNCMIQTPVKKRKMPGKLNILISERRF